MSKLSLITVHSLPLLLLLAESLAFVPVAFHVSSGPGVQSQLHATKSAIQERRKTLLSRKGPYFKLGTDSVEFGATVNLVTKLDDDEQAGPVIREWVSDDRRMARSIWQEDLITEMGNSVYELKLMKLQFVTILLQPTVETRMWVRENNNGLPMFFLQSVGFDPNLQVLPGVGLDAKSLGIVIEVVGQLAPTADGKGVEGKIAYQTSGKLPPALRVLPESALKGAADLISNTVIQFVSQSFQKGAIDNYQKFRDSISRG